MLKPIASHESRVGMLCYWLHVPRGGYGYVLPVPAKIVGLNLMGDRAIIEVQKRDGSTVRRHVLVTNLRWKTPC